MSRTTPTTKEKKNMQKAISEKSSPISQKNNATATFNSSGGEKSSSSICFSGLLPKFITCWTPSISYTKTIPSSASNKLYGTATIEDEKRKALTATTLKSQQPPFECIICFNTWSGVVYNPFKTSHCDHRACQDCMRQYVDGVLKDDRYTNYHTIECPDTDCKARFVTDDVLEKTHTSLESQKWWVTAITKTFIQNKIYCPLSGCGALYDVDVALTRKCTFTECWECNRGFCIACQDRWHPGKIKIFDDAKSIEETLKYAASKNWTRCYSCNRFVEKKSGCSAIRCRCRAEFCYRCGGKMLDHYNCSRHCQSYTMEQLATLRKPMFVNNEATTSAAAAAKKKTSATSGTSAANPITIM